MTRVLRRRAVKALIAFAVALVVGGLLYHPLGQLLLDAGSATFHMAFDKVKDSGWWQGAGTVAGAVIALYAARLGGRAVAQTAKDERSAQARLDIYQRVIEWSDRRSEEGAAACLDNADLIRLSSFGRADLQRAAIAILRLKRLWVGTAPGRNVEAWDQERSALVAALSRMIAEVVTEDLIPASAQLYPRRVYSSDLERSPAWSWQTTHIDATWAYVLADLTKEAYSLLARYQGEAQFDIITEPLVFLHPQPGDPQPPPGRARNLREPEQPRYDWQRRMISSPVRLGTGRPWQVERSPLGDRRIFVYRRWRLEYRRTIGSWSIGRVVRARRHPFSALFDLTE